ncbi:hypothetical protein BO78DRAFT_472434 [Aspergillus sclerotiicarbonarius CBS 121057]|uniref:Uncharacterized protein n=1 Tax=Aspergillus sclerotiicarbonarius (strain CBS 121057 / IBT 28362) TaxID=1448318 RepID=A0A319DY31_ASPSB|nr:hypothetical protein BO78DRAFT_472434 [Aspergillus sclerotiicarbonarius CBS 121057]
MIRESPFHSLQDGPKKNFPQIPERKFYSEQNHVEAVSARRVRRGLVSSDNSSDDGEDYEVDLDSDADSFAMDEEDGDGFMFEADHSDPVASSSATATTLSIPAGSFLKHEVLQIASSKYLTCRDNGASRFSGDLVRISGQGSPLFRWLHMNPDRLNFSEFSKVATGLPNLTDAERDDISTFLMRVETKYERPIRTVSGHNGWYMEPVLATRSKGQPHFPAVDGVSASESDYLFCCLPYFRLEQRSSTVTPEGAHIHPSQPLMQSQHPSIDRQRDLQQVVCHLPGIPQGHCYHIAALWCVIVGDKYILTCSKHLSIEHILADSITIQHSPSPSPLATETSTMPPALQLVHESRLWLLPIDQCDTWFKLTCQLSDITLDLEENFLLRWKGRIVGPPQWPRIVARARQLPTRIHLIPRKHAKEMDAGDDLFNSLAPSPEALSSVEVTTDEPTVKPEDRRLNRSPSHGPDGMGSSEHKGDMLLTDSKYGSKSSPKSLTDPRNELPSYRQGLPPLRKETNPLFNPKQFYALLWVAVSPGQAARGTISKKGKREDKECAQEDIKAHIDSYMQKLHEYMQVNNNKKAQTAYQHTAEKSREDLNRTLTGLQRAAFDSEQARSLQARLASIAESVFEVFLPIKWQSAIVSRYWGAAIVALTVRFPSPGTHVASMLKFFRLMKGVSPKQRQPMNRTLNTLDRISALGRKLQAQLSSGKGPDPTQTDIPREFVRAWYHALLCMLYWSPRDMEPAYKQSQACWKFLVLGRKKLLKRSDVRNVRELEAVLPTGLLIFMADSLVNDFTEQFPTTKVAYLEYFTELEFNVKENPLERTHRGKVTSFNDEIRIIQRHIDSQIRVLESLWDRLYPGKSGELPSQDPFYPDPQRTVLNQCFDTLKQKRVFFIELSTNAQLLIEKSTESIIENKDRQETAIFIFTIVTVIFLPLSTVTSYLGMNTSDIRNMDSKQWVFWAAAVPITLLIIILVRLWAGPAWPQPFTLPGLGPPGPIQRPRPPRPHRYPQHPPTPVPPNRFSPL